MTVTDQHTGFNDSRGSLWRKWDLHVHTPESDGYSGTWDEFKEQLKNGDCTVIGINDYFSVAGYKKLKSDSELNIGEKILLPVVEMRMTDSLQNRNTNTNGTTHFNFHIIFSETIDPDDIENFIKSLECGDTIIGSDYDDKAELKLKKVSFKDTLKKLNADNKFKNKFLIWLPYDEYGGIGDIDPNSDGWIKSDFIKKSHILGSSNQKQIEFFLWVSELNEDGTPKFTQEQFKEWFDYKKPCIKGSDSHDTNYPLGKLKDKDSNPTEKFCWIKADPTFEGLKQIVYEPIGRVKIQETEPDSKNDYLVINQVQFVDDDFMPDQLLLNQNLTAIIGGKSTGKSILLRNIAQSIDPTEVKSRLDEGNIQDYKEQITGFTVNWRDGQINKKNEDSEINKKIIYIPQSYLNRLVDQKEEQTSIDEIIKTVLEQDDELKGVFYGFEDAKRVNETKLSSEIDDLFYTIRDIEELKEKIKQIGDKKGIEAEIKKLQEEIAALKKKSGMTDQEISKYNELFENIKVQKGIIDLCNRNHTSLQDLHNKNLIYSPDLSGLSEDIQEDLVKGFQEIKLVFNQEWQKKISKHTEAIAAKKEKAQKAIAEYQKEFDPLLEKAKKSKVLEEKIDKLKKEEQNLKSILEEEEKLAKLIKTRASTVDRIATYNIAFYEKMFEAKSSILKQSVINGATTFDLAIEFRGVSFQQGFIEEVCNLKNINQFENGILNEYRFEEKEGFKKDLIKVINGIISGSLVLKSAYSQKEAIRKLLQNWFVFKYKIKQGDDDLSEMSPGKKSFVLLKLLIALDKSKCPILLDQPEDDLDNRSIYKDLVGFIKEKKKDRQIIIATHNPNLVVGADAECVIVANQSGEHVKNKTYKFEYVQGALEQTFTLENEDDVLRRQGVQEHVCDILEGGKEAFDKRKLKYNA
jgi:ABC-type cobalamin/Fe3+-siderophores transport system ATPase subunit